MVAERRELPDDVRVGFAFWEKSGRRLGFYCAALPLEEFSRQNVPTLSGRGHGTRRLGKGQRVPTGRRRSQGEVGIGLHPPCHKRSLRGLVAA